MQPKMKDSKPVTNVLCEKITNRKGVASWSDAFYQVYVIKLVW